MANKVKTSFTLTPDVIRLIKLLTKKYGISQTAVVEIAVRKFAEQENVSLED